MNDLHLYVILIFISSRPLCIPTVEIDIYLKYGYGCQGAMLLAGDIYEVCRTKTFTYKLEGLWCMLRLTSFRSQLLIPSFCSCFSPPEGVY